MKEKNLAKGRQTNLLKTQQPQQQPTSHFPFACSSKKTIFYDLEL
jgi:hypothetical protein